MKKNFVTMVSVFLLTLTACQSKDIIILYENDVHCAVEGYAKVAALREQYLDSLYYVTMVSAGDFVQGGVVGTFSKGTGIADIMNAVPYDYVTLGNHEFDYGMAQMKVLTDSLHAQVLCANVSLLTTGEYLYPAYAMHQYGRIKVAFVGVGTPTTFVSSTPTHFLDADGNVLYNFHKDDTGELVQQAVNQARKQGADYVIVLSHLGDDTEGFNSVQLIHETRGIDAVLDGHQHHVINRSEMNADGKPVILASTGTQFSHIGVLRINKGQLSNMLIDANTYTETCDRVNECIDKVQAFIASKTNRVIGYSEVMLTDQDEAGKRRVRLGETNLTDFVADAFRAAANADIVCLNGGGFRNHINAGDICYGNLVEVMPFNNIISMVEATGQQVVDALECGAKIYPDEDGDFVQVSGLKYTILSKVPSSVQFDASGLFAGVGDTRRITDVMVEGKDGTWAPINLEQTYTVAGINYILLNKGARGMFAGTKPINIPVQADIDVLESYVHALGDTIRASQYGQPQGRITIK